jgi:1-acylglycerone phosphate reductase
VIQAGLIGSAPLTHTDPAKLAAMHDIHVLGPLRLAQAFFPSISQSATPTSRGKIVNIGSVISHGLPWHAAYATTKVGQNVMDVTDGSRLVCRSSAM